MPDEFGDFLRSVMAGQRPPEPTAGSSAHHVKGAVESWRGISTLLVAADGHEALRPLLLRQCATIALTAAQGFNEAALAAERELVANVDGGRRT
jgi:hypothetical protein